MLVEIFFIIIANFLFLYLFWLKLKEDYPADQIFSTAFYILAAIIFSNIVSRRFFPNLWFWLGSIGIMTGIFAGWWRFRLRLMETMEAVILAVLPGLMFIFLTDFLKEKNLQSGFGAMVILGLIVVFFALDKHYKNFSWYKSGRIGFSGLTILGTLFLVRSVVAIKFPFMLSLAGKDEIIVSAVCAFVSFLGVFNLSRQ